ncbi:hypothetical protein K3495_g12472 [Podosphaera aphanis]|nr:hypothetical protein K3495_g12472 [Podosphaera aphanis]
MNQEVLAYLRAFVSFSQMEWASMLPTAQLALNNRDNSTTNLSPFFLSHGYHAEPVQLKPQSVDNASSPTARRADKFLDRIRQAQEFAAVAMAAAQQNMEEQANQSRSPAIKYQVGDKVWLSLKNIQTPQTKKKLAWINAKYTVTKVISPHVVELDVPTKVWPRFHVELLRKANEDPLPSQQQDDKQPPPVIDQADPQAEPEQEVERILRAENFRRGQGFVRRVLVKWVGFAEPTWEDRSELEDNVALDQFESKFGRGDGVGENEGARQGPKKPKIKWGRRGNVMGFARIGAGHRDHPSKNRSIRSLTGAGEIGRKLEGQTRTVASGRDEMNIPESHGDVTSGSVEGGVGHQGAGTR